MRQRRSPQQRQIQIANQRQQQGLLRALLAGQFDRAQGYLDRGAQLYTQPALTTLIQHPRRLTCLAWLAERAYQRRILLSYPVLHEACLEVGRQADLALTDAWWRYAQKQRPDRLGSFIPHTLLMEPTLQALTRMEDPWAYPKAAHALGTLLFDPVTPLIEAHVPNLPAKLQIWAQAGITLARDAYNTTVPQDPLPHASLTALYFHHGHTNYDTFHGMLVALERLGVDLTLAQRYANGSDPTYDERLAQFQTLRQRSQALVERPTPSLRRSRPRA